MEVVTLEAQQETEWENYVVTVSRRVQLGPLKNALKVDGIPAAIRASFPAFLMKKGFYGFRILNINERKQILRDRYD